MKRINVRLLPKDFRYLLSTKEIKLIENESNIKFKTISDSYTNRDYFKNNCEIQSSIRAFTIEATKNGNNWEFEFSINGFRNELLSKILENEIKEEVKSKTIDYLRRVIKSKETDGLNNPEMWAHIMVMKNKAMVGIHETK